MAGKYVVDFTDVEEFEDDALPRGVYYVEIEDAEIRESQEGEYDYVALTLSVLEGEYAGRKIFDNLSFSPKALWRLKSFLRAFDIDVDSGEVNVEAEVEDLIGQEIDVRTTIRKMPQDGRKMTRVSRYLPFDEGVEDEEEDEDEDEE